jgi:hypothetical protein
LRKFVTVTLAALLVAAFSSCGGRDAARNTELNRLRDEVSKGNKESNRINEVMGDMMTLRGRLARELQDDLRFNKDALETRLRDTGERIGLNRVGYLKEEGTRDRGSNVRWQVYSISFRGPADVAQRWLHDATSWSVGLYPIRVTATKDPLGKFEHEMQLAVPVWQISEQMPRLPEPPPPGPEPEDATDHEIWRLQQTLALINANRQALPGIQSELDTLKGIAAELGELKNKSQRFVTAMEEIIGASNRSGALQGYSVHEDGAEVTAVVLNDGALRSFLDFLSGASSLTAPEVESKEATRVGTRAVVKLQLR